MHETINEGESRIKLSRRNRIDIDKIARDHNISQRQVFVQLIKTGLIVASTDENFKMYHEDKKRKREPFNLQTKRRLNFPFSPSLRTYSIPMPNELKEELAKIAAKYNMDTKGALDTLLSTGQEIYRITSSPDEAIIVVDDGREQKLTPLFPNKNTQETN